MRAVPIPVVKVSIELKLRLRVLVEEWPLTAALVLPSGELKLAQAAAKLARARSEVAAVSALAPAQQMVAIAATQTVRMEASRAQVWAARVEVGKEVVLRALNGSWLMRC